MNTGPTTQAGKRLLAAMSPLPDVDGHGFAQALGFVEAEAESIALGKWALAGGAPITSKNALDAALGHVQKEMIASIDVDVLAAILMDMRVDSPLWKPPSTLTYGQASKELARRIIKELSR